MLQGGKEGDICRQSITSKHESGHTHVNQQDGPYEVEITDYHCGDSTMIKNGMRPIHLAKRFS
jgi:hypothetical protein